MDFRNKRIVVVGLGRSGVATARFLTHRGARVTVTDRKGADSMAEAIAALTGLDLKLKLGGHDPRDFETADWLPAVSPNRSLR
jgi:UDP-N-acetylmuramoylalanine--D-glutamate ligase